MEKRFDLKLNLFGEGGASGSAAGAGGEGTASAGTAGAADNQGGAGNMDRSAEFERMIKGDFKEEYDRRVKSHVDRRFRETEALRQQTEAARPLMELLAGKYGVDAGDMAAILKAAEADESYYEAEAAEKGLSVQQLKDFKHMERENARLKAAFEERQRVEQANQVQARWMQEAEALKSIYPKFNFEQEAQNPAFAKLLRSGIDVRTAYEVAHHDEIISGAMQFTAQKVQEKTVNDIRARGMRPDEGGLGKQPAGEGRLDVSKLTREQRADIARRVQQGEKITLR